MTGKKVPPLIALVIALGALAGSATWAASQRGEPVWQPTPDAYPAMMGTLPGSRSEPVSGIADAKRRAQTFADRLGLKADEVLQFERNFYVKLVDSKGKGATEVLVDPQTGFVSIEYGPAMMWNTEYGMSSGRFGPGTMDGYGMMGSYGVGYGMMGGVVRSGSGAFRRSSSADSGPGMMAGVPGSRRGGMMGGGYGAGMMGGYAPPVTGQAPSIPRPARPATPPPGATISLAEAHALAQTWLDANEQGTKVEQNGDAFPGYYTLETLREGKITGMISVNAATGAVWAHWWHGKFVAMSE